jgi:hypothetical protein
VTQAPTQLPTIQIQQTPQPLTASTTYNPHPHVTPHTAYPYTTESIQAHISPNTAAPHAKQHRQTEDDLNSNNLPPSTPPSPLTPLPRSPPPTPPTLPAPIPQQTPSPDTQPSVRRSSQIPIPTSRYLTNDSLTHHRRAVHYTNHHIPDHSPLVSFITEFLPLRQTHYLHPCHLDPHLFQDINLTLMALTDGSTELEVQPDDDPSWTQAIASPEQEFWIAGAQDKLKSL